MADIDELAKTLLEYMRLDTPIARSDVLIGMGTLDTRIATRTAQLFLDGFGDYIIFTGGHGKLTKHTQIDDLSQQLKPDKWYMHFWKGDDVVVVFPGKMFKFKHSDQSTWSDALEYGKSINIPEEQLDFIIE